MDILFIGAIVFFIFMMTLAMGLPLRYYLEKDKEHETGSHH